MFWLLLLYYCYLPHTSLNQTSSMMGGYVHFDILACSLADFNSNYIIPRVSRPATFYWVKDVSSSCCWNRCGLFMPMSCFTLYSCFMMSTAKLHFYSLYICSSFVIKFKSHQINLFDVFTLFCTLVDFFVHFLILSHIKYQNGTP